MFFPDTKKRQIHYFFETIIAVYSVLTNRGGRKINTPLSYWQRYTKIAFKYGSAKKYVNLARAYYNYRKGTAHIPTKPAFLKVEISRKCTVNCKYCYEKKDDVFFPLVSYKQLIDKLKDYIFLVSLYDIGEPLQNDQFSEYVEYANKRKIGTIISTSLSLERSDDFWKELVTSGLDRMIVAIDGVTPEVYNQYRTNGDLELVMKNLKKILAYRTKYKSDLVVEWQIIDLPWNKSEQSAAKEMAKKLGCDEFRIIKEAVLDRKNYKCDNIIRCSNCLLPYIILIITAYGQVRPCYKVYTNDDAMILGDLSRDTYEHIWNNGEISKIRDKDEIRSRPCCMTCQE